MPTPVFRAESVDGALVFQQPEHVSTALRAMDGKPLDVTVRVHRDIRSLRANAYYWSTVLEAVVEGVREWQGEDSINDAHENLAMHFLRISDDPVTGAPRRLRTPEANTKEFSEYLDKVIRFAAERGIEVPEPRYR
tara:strand:- start:209 stop:616 length:408 start_codon:yes stop_codon:yes gene_type:complete